ncbi:GNAT family N-acetyltransferase [Rhodohalobacter barkolensis]|uniref:GNAT family N-acetyltransferase n=1 Tax=Rhodohalobacter barkolensis TaxID=2053187 RepID=A0A2N0VFD4_9BACT|nr:GNAT family N-acetyltransferase [Rhodohalobacter barkolensis]PKD42911.1 GNAT family N-acetyltransferase [Rhodohalobacter barkolensis]
MLIKKTVHGSQIKPYLKQIGELRINVFREFPYLYDGSAEYEQEYLKKYIDSDESIAAMVLDDDQLVGVSTGIPLSDESYDFKKPFSENGYNLQNIYYCGESVLLPSYRGLGLYSHFFSERENYAKSLDRFELITFCAVDRDPNHPLRPDNYTPLDPVWEKYGYRKAPQLIARFPWKDIDETEETQKELVFWTKQLT